jgi:membrane protein
VTVASAIAALRGFLPRLYREADEDGISGEAAKVAYYAFLSLFPFIIALFALTGIFGGKAAFAGIMAYLRDVLPASAAGYLERFVREVTEHKRPGLLSLGALLTLWSASTVFVSLIDGLNAVYDVRDDRGWWRRRLIALFALAGSLVLLVGGTAALLAGPPLVVTLHLVTLWDALRWPLAFGAITAMMWLAYTVLPNRRGQRRRVPTLAGAGVGAGLWLLATWGLQQYLARFGTFSRTYGVVGGVIVLLLWLYLTSLAVLLGGEVAATAEAQATDRRTRRPQEPATARGAARGSCSEP